MLVLLDIPPELQGFVMGVVIVAAVLLQRGKRGAGG
jgi:ribose/xylose/arabinose/galactoside ABC-type transport system permease subunit